MSWIHRSCEKREAGLELAITCLTEEIKGVRKDLERAQSLNAKFLDLRAEQVRPIVIPPEPKEKAKPKISLRTWMKQAEDFEQ